MIHPEESLVGYVDGTLSAKERHAVESHVAECARCNREIALATSARSALRSLPEVPAPPGVATQALDEAGGGRRFDVAGGPPRWYRVGGIVAAAAAALLVLTLVLPHIGQGEGSGSDAARGKAEAPAGDAREAAAALAAPSGIEIRHVNYDNTSLTELTSSFQGGASGGAASDVQAPGSLQFGNQAQTDKALACVTQSAPDESGNLQSLIRARFERTPAYLAVFLEGPGAGQPDDSVTVWVFATEDCRILSFSTAQL
jgi:hypothetical protein